jgi:uncharacterized protein with NRDE domain
VCTLTVAWQALPDTPVAVAANRDEADDRPSTPPRVRSEPAGSGEPRILAPRDERAGGTWIGVSDAGVFAGITNRWTDATLAGERSRGQLVADALAAPTAADAMAVVRDAVERHEYDGFYLTVLDESDGVVLGWDGTLTETHLDPGVHVVVNVGVDDQFDVPEYRRSVGERQAANARRARADLEGRPGESVDDWLDRARAVLTDHEYGLCVHENGYGTQSSSIVTIADDGAVTYEFAPGPPCRTAFESVSHDL